MSNPTPPPPAAWPPQAGPPAPTVEPPVEPPGRTSPPVHPGRRRRRGILYWLALLIALAVDLALLAARARLPRHTGRTVFLTLALTALAVLAALTLAGRN
jgi:hypothetical protein